MLFRSRSLAPSPPSPRDASGPPHTGRAVLAQRGLGRRLWSRSRDLREERGVSEGGNGGNEGRTDVLATHEGVRDNLREELVLAVELGLDLATRAVREEAGDHLKVRSELAQGLRGVSKEGRETSERRTS